LTVVMPVYNTSIYLRDSIKSILNQRGIDFNFLILDDGSEEKIEKIISELNDNKITFVKLNRVGLISTLNEGLRLCNSKYFALLDSDDIAPEDRLVKQLGFLENNPSIGLVGTSIKYIADGINYSRWAVKMPSDHFAILKGLHEGKYVLVHSTIMLRTAVLKKINGYREESYPVPDTDLFIRMSKLSNLANISDIYSLVRLHEDSMTAKNLMSIIEKNHFIIRKKEMSKLNIYKNYFALMNYRKGIISYLKRNYVNAFLYFLFSFLFAPQRSIYYLKNKYKLIL